MSLIIYLIIFFLQNQHENLNIEIYYEDKIMYEPKYNLTVMSSTDTIKFENRVDLNLFSSKFQKDTVTFVFYLLSDSLVFSNIVASSFISPPTINLIQLKISSSRPLEYSQLDTSPQNNIQLFCSLSCALCGTEYIYFR